MRVISQVVFLVSRRQSSLLAACHCESHSLWLKSHAEGQTPPLLLAMGPRAGYLTPRGLYFLVNMMGKPYQVIGVLNRIIGRKIQQAVSFTFSLLEETQNLKKKKKGIFCLVISTPTIRHPSLWFRAAPQAFGSLEHPASG